MSIRFCLRSPVASSSDRFPPAQNSKGVLEQWVSLEVPLAHGLSLHDGCIAVACANGLVRMFRASDLCYIATLPRPPPLGHANVSSIRELQVITEASASDSTASPASMSELAEIGPEREAEHVPSAETKDGDLDSGYGVRGGVPTGALDCEGGSGGVLSYPATLGCRLSPSGTKVVCVYADRSFFIWDVADPLCIGKYRSFLAHGGRIWDIQRMPGEERWIFSSESLSAFVVAFAAYSSKPAQCLLPEDLHLSRPGNAFGFRVIARMVFFFRNHFFIPKRLNLEFSRILDWVRESADRRHRVSP